MTPDQALRSIRLNPATFEFAKVDGVWCVVGPRNRLEPGTSVRVWQRRDEMLVPVTVGTVLCSRTVVHRDHGPVDYVVVTVIR